MSKKTHRQRVDRARSRERAEHTRDRKFNERMDRRAREIACAVLAGFNVPNADMFLLFGATPREQTSCA